MYDINSLFDVSSKKNKLVSDFVLKQNFQRNGGNRKDLHFEAAKKAAERQAAKADFFG